jgi:hypothetical protein
VPRHVARLVTQLVVDYFHYATCPGASARRAARHEECRAARRRLLRLRRASGCLGTSRGSSLVVDYFAYAARLVVRLVAPLVVDYFAFARVWVPRHVARLVTRLVVDYSGRCGFLLWPHWLYFSHAVRRDYLSRGNTGSTSSTPRAAATSSSGCIASTIHLD